MKTQSSFGMWEHAAFGPIPAIVASIGSLFTTSAATATAAAAAGATGAAATAGSITAASLLGGLGTVGAGVAAGSSIAALAKGPPKLSASPITEALNQSPSQPTLLGGARANTNKSLASLSPGLALAGTASGAGYAPAPTFGQKTLLGQ